MKWTLSAAILALAAVLLAGCLNPARGHAARRYAEIGLDAERAGDLKLAEDCYWRAYVNADLGFIGLGPKAYALFDHSRVMGYLGNHAKAAQGFSNVLHWIEISAPKVDALRAPAFSEYARLLHDTGQHAKALPLFESAVIELDRVDGASKDPIGLAEFLEDYAESLRASARNADDIAERARLLREANAGAVAKQKPRRYGSKMR